MFVKDIRKFREFYKTNIKITSDSNRDPHFAGGFANVNGEIRFGFFEMFNGEGNIENKLTTILNMAGDSQAIYEFMQNAVDADSRNFFLAKYGDSANPYLIVLNDGDYFTLQSVISILAIGDSSKYRNPDSIGQFGVGFKLAHRLIGADNSLKELLDENRGPILFSWANGELASLVNEQSVETVDPECVGFKKEAQSNSTAPWLFKIVATNFPCLTDDAVQDTRGRFSDSLFTEEDWAALQGAAQQCLKQCSEAASFNTGTLLVIPLHPAKVKHVIGENPPKGLEIAATIISRRANKAHDLRTQIEQKELVPEPLLHELWQLPEEEMSGNLGNEQTKNVELMFLYGNPFEGNPFQGKPQFYRYFPMALELHGFRFAIHGNALTVSSARTELQENDSNKFLLKKLTEVLEEKLKKYAEEEPDRFLNLYASLLLSNRSEGGQNWMQGRQWLEEALWLPLMQVLQRSIPVRSAEGFVTVEQGNNVLIKNSRLPIESWYIKENRGWFYWEEKNQALACFQAKDKLGLKAINLLDVLSDAASSALANEWLAQSPDHASLFLAELNESVFEGYDKGSVWKAFNGLRLWWIEGSVYSLEELAKEEGLKFHLVNYGPLNSIRQSLLKAGIYLSQNYLDDYGNIERSIRESAQRLLPYLFNYEELNKLLSVRFSVTGELTAEDKKAIFTAIEAAVRGSANKAERRVESMKPLAIFSNKRGEVKPLNQLTSIANVPVLLQGWRISEGETVGLNLNEYLSNTQESIYEEIVKPFWDAIATQEGQSSELRASLFAYVKACYTLKPTMGALPSEAVFFSEEGQRTAPFYHPSLLKGSEESYPILSKLLAAFGIHLPQRSLLHFYNEAPFILPAAETLPLPTSLQVLVNEAQVLLRWLVGAFPDLIKSFTYQEVGEHEILMKEKVKGVNNYYSQLKSIQDYVAAHHSVALVPLPKSLSFLSDKSLHGDELMDRLIFEAQARPERLMALSEVLMGSGNDASKQKLLSKISSLNLATPVLPGTPEYNLLKLCFSISDEPQRKEVLGGLLQLLVEGQTILLKNVQNRGSDTLEWKYPQKGTLTFSVDQLLGGEANHINLLLKQVLEQWVEAGVAGHDEVEKVLGIKERRKPQEVWEQMLSQLTEGRLENGEQLAFVWAYGSQKGLAKTAFQVNTMSGWVPFSGAFYLKALPFIPGEKVLADQYFAVTRILNIINEQIDGGEWTLQQIPFIQGVQLIMPQVIEVSDEQKPALWKFLFDAWTGAEEPKRIMLSEKGQNWNALLGSDPSQYVLVDRYSLADERPPFQSLEVLGLKKEKLHSFLLALGALDETSPLVQTRKYFKKEGGKIDTGMPPFQIVATLKWLAANKLAIRQDEIAIFYRNLEGKCNDLVYFPAYQPAMAEMVITDVTNNTFHIAREEMLQAKNLGINQRDIADVAKVAVINLGILQDWEKHIKSKTSPLSIQWRVTDWEAAQAEGQEWAFPFYQQWKDKYRHFQIFHLPGGDIPKKVVINDQAVKTYRAGKLAIFQDTNIVYVGGADTEHLLIEVEKNPEVFTASAREHLRQCYQAQAEQFEQYVELAKNDAGFAQLLKDRAEVLKLQEERAEKARIVKDKNTKYTLDWFLSLLDLVRSQEKSVAVPEVTFSKCERLPAAEKTYELSEFIGRIPANIESFEEIPAVITYLDAQGETTSANTKLVASEKHQKLWVMFPEATVHPILADPKKIKSVKLVFTRTVDLIEELKRGYGRLNLSGTINLKDTLSPNIDFLFGPPGTGKTTELAKRILARIKDGKNGPAVVLTPTNKAADVLTRKIVELNGGIAPAWLIRAGNCTDPYLLQIGAVKFGDDLLIESNDNAVLITTIHRFSYFDVPISRTGIERARLCDCPWTEVIFDEASMIPLAYIVFAIQTRQKANDSTRFLVAGDPLQIPPVFDLLNEDLEDVAESLQQENIYTMIGLSSFDKTVQQSIPVYGNRIENLETQHRSISAIGEIFSKFQYGGRIQHSRGTVNNPKPGVSRSLPSNFARLGFKPITIIRYPVKSGDSIFKPQKLGGSPLHLYSSLLVSELIKAFRSEVRKDEDKQWSVGVLAPYRSQADLLLKMIEAHPNQHSAVSVTTDTVHGFQGDENNIVFAVFNPSGTGDNIRYSRFLQKQFIINVAISRAEDYLVMLIPDDDSKGINGLPLLSELMKIANQTTPGLLAVVHSSEIEEQLKGKKKFFETNCFSTSHQKVNVYGKPDLPYIVRINENSLDVHWEV